MHNPVRPVIVEDANAQLAGRVFNKTLPGLAGTSGAAGANGNSTLVYQDGTAPAGNTVANTTVETAITSTYSFGANTLKVGSTIRVRLFGLYSTALVAPSLTLKLKLGATTVLSSGALALLTGITAAGWSAEALMIVTAIGAGGTIECQGDAEYATAATTNLSANITNAAAIAVDTTGALALTVTLQWSAASASNTITARQMIVEAEDTGGAVQTTSPPFSATPTLSTTFAEVIYFGALTANVTAFNLSGTRPKVIVCFVQDGTGGRTVTAGASIDFGTTSGLTSLSGIAATASAYTYVGFVYNPTTAKFRLVAIST